ncbi:MAG: DUF3696 domain-containing protein [Chloroflexi bacterium]|nr:MAG: DUF3696 domain-containing protein [Chloroflexota bacterium]
MITQLEIHNFKSWEDLPPFPLGKITGFFGPNSSGKTGVLQFLLMLKQTVESTDRSLVLHLGDERTLVDLGTFQDVIYRHDEGRALDFAFKWQERLELTIGSASTSFQQVGFEAQIGREREGEPLRVASFRYRLSRRAGEAPRYTFGMSLASPEEGTYDLTAKGFTPKRSRGRPWPLPAPVRFYGFPDETFAYYQNVDFLSQVALALEKLFSRIYYLGPLREYPKRRYIWSGEVVSDVGQRGELAVPALLASRARGRDIRRGRGRGYKRCTVEERVAEWLREMKLIHSFRLEPIAEGRKDYEVRIRRTPQSPEVFLTDVGFGVSQILPVLVLCYYAPEGSILLFEQPEIHLHPSVQYALADVFLDAARWRGVQIIVESHSEYLLQRLQRRVAEDVDGQLARDIRLYFTDYRDGRSILTPLEMDEYGTIVNWPEDFFGDRMGEAVARTEAAMRRKLGGDGR